MSTPAEKLEAIRHAVQIAEKEVRTLETIQSVSKLSREQIYKLDMARGVVERGRKLLRNSPPPP